MLFIPANSKKMLSKIEHLKPDAFILDLEDSVPSEQKEEARSNIAQKMKEIEPNQEVDQIYVRINDLDTHYPKQDVIRTLDTKITGYMIPKFEKIEQVKKIESLISNREKEQAKPIGSTKFLLLIESMKGIYELNHIDNLRISNRLIGIAFGGEDYLSSLSRFGEISEDMLDFARRMILFHAKARDLLAIDTVYKNFRDPEGLKKETNKIVRMGFDGKLAIHPNQIEIINTSFTPADEEIIRMKTILQHKEEIEKNGVFNSNGIMLDRAHLKWALKVYDLWMK